MSLLMNKFISIVMDDWNLDEVHVNYWNNVWYINIIMNDWDWDLDENPLSKWQLLEHCKYVMPKIFYKEWQLMLVT
jgi:hypothetical protein